MVDLEDGWIVEADNAAGGIKTADGAEFFKIDLERTWVKGGRLSKDSHVWMGKSFYKFKAKSRLGYVSENVYSGTLAEPVASPYGSGIVHTAGKSVYFLSDGNLIEDSMECYRRLFPHIDLSRLVETQDLTTIMRNFSALPSALRASINGLRFDYKKDVPHDRAKVFKDEWGHVDLDTNKIHLWTDVDDHLNRASFFHEAAHCLVNKLDNEGSDFSDRWRDLNSKEKNVYGEGVEKLGADTIVTKWSKPDKYGEAEGPRRGCISSYGCQNLHEDVATHVECLDRDPDLYAQLINPLSQFYLSNPEQRKYASVYRDKLDLLMEYGFVSRRRYFTVILKSKAS
jgi:hypothetical protein